jgi:putative addiction module killer protein
MLVEDAAVYHEWINSLKDLAGRARIQVRVDRLVHGHPGKRRVLTEGVSELKIDFGPGYRFYYTTQRGDRLLLLLA